MSKKKPQSASRSTRSAAGKASTSRLSAGRRPTATSSATKPTPTRTRRSRSQTTTPDRASLPTPREPHPIEVIARGCLRNGSRVLLCENLKHRYFYLPGGHVEFGESAAGAIEREILEEGGFRVTAGNLALVTEGSFSTKRRLHHEINLVFHVEPSGRVDLSAVRSIEPHIGLGWVELAAIADLDVRPLAVKAWLASLGNEHSADLQWISEMTRATGPHR